MGRARRVEGICLQLLDGATSSGTQSHRAVFEEPYQWFGVSALLASSSQAGACTVALYGSAAGSTAAKYGSTICTWSTDDGVVAYNTTGVPARQVWAELTLNTSSGATDVWVTALP